MTGNTLFHSKVLVNDFKMEVYILKPDKKISTAFVIISQGMKTITKANDA